MGGELEVPITGEMMRMYRQSRSAYRLQLEVDDKKRKDQENADMVKSVSLDV